MSSNNIETRTSGHWIETTKWFGGVGKAYHECSECGTKFEGVPFSRGDGKGSKFCEECGAKMDTVTEKRSRV